MDYVGITEPVILTFSQSSLTRCVNITILPDNIVEQDETFLVVVVNRSNEVLFPPPSAAVVIVDSDEGRSDLDK